MKKIIILLTLYISLFAEDIVVFNNEHTVFELKHKVKKVIVGNQDIINVSILDSSNNNKLLKIFGKKSGNTSILVIYSDNSLQNFHVYVNQNLGFIQKMINIIEPNLLINKVGDGSTVISGEFKDPHDKKRIFSLLKNAGVNLDTLMDITHTKKVNKMVKTKLYLVEINNQRAKELKGVTGLSIFNKYTKVSLNPNAINGATFSGFLLDHTGDFISQTGQSLIGTLNFLEEKGIAKVLDDTVLITTEDKNASFRVGGEVYIPVGLTQNIGVLPTIQLKEKEYGLHLTLNSRFMEKADFMHINVGVTDSQFDTNKEHYVQLGEYTFVPSFVSKNIQTNIVVQSGQVIALGGRLHTEKTIEEEKIPLLGDIPMLGELFKSTVSGSKENDLLIFLVPEIVDANEDIDDSRFYGDFKYSSEKFHENILDMNISHKEPLTILSNDNDIVKIEDPNTTIQDEKLVIEVEDNELPINKNKDVATEISVNKDNESADKLSNKKFTVSCKKIFLRQKPANGKRIVVWKEGHAFTAKEEKNINGTLWLRIDQDCFNSCTKLENELWISKKYVKNLPVQL